MSEKPAVQLERLLKVELGVEHRFTELINELRSKFNADDTDRKEICKAITSVTEEVKRLGLVAKEHSNLLEPGTAART